MRRRAPPGLLRRSAQHGAALLIALLTVTLVATFAATALWQQWRATEVEAAERARLQSAWVLVSALDWARIHLREDSRTIDSLNEPWAVPLAEARLSSFLAADKNVASDELAGLPEAFLSGHIVDAHSKLNVRNLVENGQPVDKAVAAFQKLFDLLNLPPEQVTLLVEGVRRAMPVAAVTATGTPTSPPTDTTAAAPTAEAATDVPLMPQRVHQLTWFGLPASTIAAISPYVTVLPAHTLVNINTASAEVLAAGVPELDLAGAQRVVSLRQSQPIAELAKANEWIQPVSPGFLADSFGVTSHFFETVGRLRLDTHWVEEHALVQRTATNLTVIWRERGAGTTPALASR